MGSHKGKGLGNFLKGSTGNIHTVIGILVMSNYSNNHIIDSWRLQVEPGKPGAEVSKNKNYKSKKEFAYRMCTGWPTTAMPKPSFLSERAVSRSMVVMW